MLSKKQTWNKEPKAYKKPEYLEWLHNNAVCMICSCRPIEVHHIRQFSIKGRDDRYVLPLCAQHHRLTPLSPHATPKAFLELYDIETQIAIATKLYKTYKCY